MSESPLDDLSPELISELASEETHVPSPGLRALNWLRMQPPVLIGVIVIAAIAACIMGILVLRSLLGGDSSTSQVPTLDPNVLAEYAVPTSDPILMDRGTPQPQTNIPISIAMKGLDFQILPYQVQANGEWRYPAGQSGTAVWIYGTIINYIVGIEQTRANMALMESFAPGDEITMTTSDGRAYHFGFAGLEELTSPGADILGQTSPGLTLITLGGKDKTRLVVHGEYLLAREEGGAGQNTGPSISVGEPAQLDEIRVTALETSYLYDTPDIPEGWAFYLVDYQIENHSQDVLDPNRFRMVLQDGAGNTYSINLPASQAGSFGYLMLTIPPNTVAMGTAGYLVPTPLQGPKLTWSFSQLEAPEYIVKVLIDFEVPQETVDPFHLVAVNLSGAELSGDRTLLSVWGTVLNNSEEMLVVDMEYITLQGADESMALRAADPALPWTISPGETSSFRLAFQRPSSLIATFTLLNQPFEISGLE